LLWNTAGEQLCKNNRCRAKLRWGDFHIDHKRAYSRGGQTSLDNAQLLCPECNMSKGASSWGRRKNLQGLRAA
jgi:5-methylcytosine-specific restriction endonuclease McrA